MKYHSQGRCCARQLTGLLGALGLASTLLLSACSGADSGNPGMSESSSGQTSTDQSTSSQNGTAMVTLTDDPGDFVTYQVIVDSLQLTRADGTVVETVPTTTLVDFAQLVNLSEIISADQVPAGQYTSVTLTLDYSMANIVVDNGTTSGLTVTNILDNAGAPITSPVQLTLQLPSGSPLVITPGSVANLALEFNLAATNALVTFPGPPFNPVVDTSPATPPAVYIGSITSSSAIAVEVSPSLAASLTPDSTKQICVRGPLVGTSGDSYTINVRPFFNASGSQGTFTVNTTSTTTFIINGTSYTTQSAGMAALTALMGTTPPTLTLAYGTFDVSTGVFTASEVLAGSSVTGASMDSVEGTVTARTISGSSDTLTVSRGRIIQAWQSGFMSNFGHTVTVDIGPGTLVTEDGQPGSYTIADISVGQHVQVFGKYSNSSGTPTLDATAGSARLMVTDLWGMYLSSTSNGGAGNVVTLNLRSLDGLEPSAFQFAGTGINSSQDATASAYTVGVPAALSLPSWSTNAPANFAGFVSPFGTADNTSTPIVPDFSSITLVNYTGTSAQLILGWALPGVASPFASLTGASTTLMLTQSTLQGANWYRFRLGPEQIPASQLSSGLTLSADATATMTQFGIAHVSSHKIDTFTSLSALIGALYGDLNPAMGTAPTVLGVFADGPYDMTTFDLSADRLAIALSD